MKIISAIIVITFLFTNTTYSSTALRVPVGQKNIYDFIQKAEKFEAFEVMTSSYSAIKIAAGDGTLEVLVPEWLMIKESPQYGPHQFTVDKHILRTIEMAEELGYAGHVSDARRLRRILLLHDIGKDKNWRPGQPDTHPLQSAVLAEKILNRLGYPLEIIKKDVWQIKYHFVIGCMAQMGYFDITEEDPVEWSRQLENIDDVQMLKAINLSDRAGKTNDPTQYLAHDAIERLNDICGILSRIAIASGKERLELEDELRSYLMNTKKDYINRLINNLDSSNHIVLRAAIYDSEVALREWDKLDLDESIKLQLVKALDLAKQPLQVRQHDTKTDL